MKPNIWKIGFFTGLILTLVFFTGLILSSLIKSKPAIVHSESVDIFLGESQDISRSAQFTASQLKQLVSVDRKKFRVKKLYYDEFEDRELRVIVPTYILFGFKVDKLEVIDNNSENSYKIIYRNSNNLCFYIGNSISGLIQPSTRPPSSTEAVEINSPFINETANLAITKYDRASTNSSISLEFSKVEFESPCTEKDRVITTSEAVKIVESLQYLNP
ncbi:MAG: hypothetical protein F6K24_50970 [Okeania sp. SIO2D1]|nr:hypothetical protein [Okeania sp. SIO2D1]